jgi:hypothetical protein
MGSNCNPFTVQWVLSKLRKWWPIGCFSKVRFFLTRLGRFGVIKVVDVSAVK